MTEKKETAMVKHQSMDIMEMSDNQYARLKDMADVMSNSVVTVPKHLIGKPADCMAIIMQAKSWGMDPMPVAQKTHLINGTLGYEAQLVNAVITSSGVLNGRPKYEYGGDWSKIEGKLNWSKQDEEGLYCKITAKLNSTGDELEWTTYLTSCTTRNSPNWKNKVKLQLSYQTLKEFCRIHTPDVILGVYTDDEIRMGQTEIIEVNAEPVGESRTEHLAQILTGKKAKTEDKPKAEEPEEEIEVKAEEPEPNQTHDLEEKNEEEQPKPKRVTKAALSKATGKTGAPDSLIKAYCVSCGVLEDDQTLDDLPHTWKQRIVDSPDSFKKALDKWDDEVNSND